MDLGSHPVLLDTGVLGLVTHPSSKAEPTKCKKWFEARLQATTWVTWADSLPRDAGRIFTEIREPRLLVRLVAPLSRN